MLARHISNTAQPLLNRLVSNSPLSAVRFVRRMRGQSQACLIECSDGDFYVVKFFSNPTGPNLLANEMLGGVLCISLGIPVPDNAPIYLSPSFVEENEQSIAMWRDDATRFVPPVGIHLGSKVVRPRSGSVLEYVRTSTLLNTIAQHKHFIGMSVLDLCTDHRGRRQALYIPNPSGRPGVSATFIDHGSMFGGPHWSFSGSDTPRAFSLPIVNTFRSTRACLGWAKQIQRTVPDVVGSCVPLIPSEWYSGSIPKLVEFVSEGTRRLPLLIERAADEFVVRDQSEEVRHALPFSASFLREWI